MEVERSFWGSGIVSCFFFCVFFFSEFQWILPFISWHDGFSTFYLGSDGFIHKHVADKMMPDDDRVPVIAHSPQAGAAT